MNVNHIRTNYLSILVLAAAPTLLSYGTLGCSSDSSPSGESNGTGGLTGTGGASTGGGVTMASGGSSSGGSTPAGTGGSSSGSGGTQASGGGAASGGTANTGGGGTSVGGAADCNSYIVSSQAAANLTASAACAECLCTSCGAQVAAVRADPLAETVVTCSQKNNVNGDCSFCGAVCTAANYGTGKCAREIEKAAGIPSPSTTADYPALQAACDDANKDNSCRRPQNLASCAASQCGTQCPGLIPACP